MIRQYVDLCSLVGKTTTRERGDEAFAKLLPILNENPCIELDLTHADLLSNSFLDELVLKTAKANLLNSVIFVADSARLRKLERVFSMRGDFCGKYRLPGNELIRPISAKRVVQQEPVEELI